MAHMTPYASVGLGLLARLESILIIHYCHLHYSNYPS